jgi:hypothetical protein
VPCVKALPKLKTLHKEFGDKGLVVICVLVPGTEEEAPEFVKKHNIAFPVMVDAGMTVKRYHPEQYNGTYLVVDPTGKVVPRGSMRQHSAPTAAEIKELLNR